MNKHLVTALISGLLGAGGATLVQSLNAAKTTQVLTQGAQADTLECAKECATKAWPVMAKEEIVAVCITPDPTQGQPYSLSVGMLRDAPRPKRPGEK